MHGDIMSKKKLIIIFICFIIFIPFSTLLIKHYQSKDGLPIIGYHNVVSDEDKETKYKSNRYTLSVSQFKEHMQYLYDHHYQTLTMDEVNEYYLGNLIINENSVVLTFDDGYKDFNRIVKPILEEYGFHGTCFVIGKHVNDNNPMFLKEEDIQNNETTSYYSHSFDLHRTVNGFDKKIIETMSLEEINEDFQKNPVDCTYFAYPYGRTVDHIDEVLENNHVQLAFCYNQFKNMTPQDNRYYLPRYMFVDIMPMFYFKYIVQ